MRFELARPNLTAAEIDAVVAVLRTPNLSLGPKLVEFEARFAEHCRTGHAVAVSSGTAALHICMRALELTDGDEVITTPFSFIASANCIAYERARPVFVDIDPDTWNIDPVRIEPAITDRTRALLPVDVFGQTCPFDALLEIADRRGLPIIEDACEALGGTYRGQPAGSFGRAGVFGFYPNKQITTGEGGMIVTHDGELARLARSLRNQGRDPDASAWLAHDRLGYNYRLSDLNCALGIVQLGRLDEIVAERRRVDRLYREHLADENRVSFQRIAEHVEMSPFVLVVRLADRYEPADRDRILGGLRKVGIGCSNYFTPIHLQPFYRRTYGYAPGDFPICEALAARTLALPFHHELTEADVATICQTLRDLL